MPIILKGIATAEDAVLAYEAGVQGIVLSNHGGRQLDTARSGLEVLIEVTAALRARGYFPDPKFEIYVDGGVRRASDVLKALALGAKAVGVGRPFLYAFCSYGQAGVEKAIQIFRDEFEMNMRLLGARTIDELVPEMVDATTLTSHVVLAPRDNLFHETCESPSFSLWAPRWTPADELSFQINLSFLPNLRTASYKGVYFYPPSSPTPRHRYQSFLLY